MPNWCTNKLVVSGEPSTVKAISELIGLESERVMDFDRVIPMPPSLKITSGSSTYYGLEILEGDWRWLLTVGWFKDRLLEIYGREPESREDLIQMLETVDQQPAAQGKSHQVLFNTNLTEARIAQNNRIQYGHTDWYDWSIDNWGTKWNAGDVTQDHIGDRGFIIYFDTAWSPPVPVIEALIARFPEADIRLSYMEPGVGFAGEVNSNGDWECPESELEDFYASAFDYWVEIEED